MFSCDKKDIHKNAYTHQTIGELKILFVTKVYSDSNIGIHNFVTMLNEHDLFTVEQSGSNIINIKVKKTKKSNHISVPLVYNMILPIYLNYLNMNKVAIESVMKKNKLNYTIDQLCCSNMIHSMLNIFPMSDTQIIIKL